MDIEVFMLLEIALVFWLEIIAETDGWEVVSECDDGDIVGSGLLSACVTVDDWREAGVIDDETTDWVTGNSSDNFLLGWFCRAEKIVGQ